MTGIIFDFNGTMFQDSHFHEEAWIHMIKKYSNKTVTDDDILMNIHGRTNNKILRYFISENLTDAEIKKLSIEKEAFYRELVLKNPEQIKFTEGLTEVLDKLKEKNIPFTIATATGEENIGFYFDTFNLHKWFSLEKIVYNDGTFPGKPAPDIFLLSAKKLGLDPKDCVVVEDAFSGLLAAKRANIGQIIAIDPFHKNEELFSSDELKVDGVIADFEGFLDVIYYG